MSEPIKKPELYEVYFVMLSAVVDKYGINASDAKDLIKETMDKKP